MIDNLRACCNASVKLGARKCPVCERDLRPRDFIVNFSRLPEGVSVKEAAEYIQNAVRTHAGGLDDSDPMSGLSPDTVEVMFDRSY